MSDSDSLSPRRLDLCRWEHAYACAIQRYTTTGRDQFVIRTGNALQPFRVIETRPANDEDVILRVA
jgi:hypothetical protein